MGKVSFTKEQQQVIDARNGNLLVSAAAGSGKTAVLTERILSLITDQERPVDIDRLLVVTFTKAAAAEMRERIGKAIDERLTQDPTDRHLLRQMALLHNAQITTIDSFCLFLIRNNFGDIGLDPGFRIMEEGERKLLMKDTMDELLEAYYQKKDEDFFFLAECYGENGQDLILEEMILSLYHYALSHPDPKEWLRKAAEGYLAEDFKTLEESVWWKAKAAENDQLIERLLLLAEEAVCLCGETDGPAAYFGTVEAQRNLLTALAENKGYQIRYELLQAAEIPKLGRTKKTDDKELCSRVKMLRDRIKEGLDQLSECYYDAPEHILQAVQETKATAQILLKLTGDFMERFAMAKRERNVLDFSDMEHFALDILLEKNETGEMLPTRAAKEYQDYFAYVMVDEYQDSNYVQEFILKSIARDDNYFMVGDVKQSIYRFRLARPEIFMEKYATYHEDGPAAEKNRRIDLNRNFRSRKEVLDSVNDVFSVIMTEAGAGIAYDEKAKLYPGAVYPENPEAVTELILVEKPVDEEEKKQIDQPKELEALYVAGRIKELLRQGFLVADKNCGGERPVSYGDIVILLRSMDGYGEVFRNVLETQGIPVYSNTKTGYFSTLEVRTVMNVLQVLDNPRQDIPLYGMMASFVGGFTEEELAKIKARGNVSVPAGRKYNKKCFYDVVQEYHMADRSGDCSRGEDVIREKLDHLLSFIEKYRKKAKYTGIRELLEEILDRTGYLDYVTALPGGKQRRANLMMLLERASDFEQTSYSGLFHFVRYINQLKEQEVDYGEAGMLDEHADVVRIMTIHKSKGLEFPVCFLCGLGKRINKRDVTKPVLLDSEYGIGLDNINPGLRIRRPCLQKKVIAEKILADSIAEEMRILYVAMTRAKDKLIMTGTVNQLEKTIEKWQQLGAFASENVKQYTSYLDFLLAAYGSSGKIDQYVTGKTAEEILEQLKITELETWMDRESLESLEQLPEGTWEAALEERFAEQYPYPELEGLYTKTTVSELKKAAYEDTEAYQMFDTEKKEAYLPKFMQKEESSSLGTQRGTAVHRILELLDYKNVLGVISGKNDSADHTALEQFVRKTLEETVSCGKISAEEAGLINISKCAHFLESDLARRMMEADQSGKLYKEKAFFIGVPASWLKKEFPAEETILVQGVIDVYFEEEDGLVLADYKTDRVAQARELRDRYHIQLEIYADALEQITGKHVKQKLIYSFALGCEIPL